MLILSLSFYFSLSPSTFFFFLSRPLFSSSPSHPLPPFTTSSVRSRCARRSAVAAAAAPLRSAPAGDCAGRGAEPSRASHGLAGGGQAGRGRR